MHYADTEVRANSFPQHHTSHPKNRNAHSSAPHRLCKKELAPEDLEHFVRQARQIATDITDFRATYNLSDGFSRIWKDAKRLVHSSNVEEAKIALRSQGCSQFFVEAVDALIQLGMKGENGVQCTEGQQRMRVARFLIALRLAIHLSPDKGCAISQSYNAVFHPHACPRPNPLLARAYEAYKVRATMGTA